MNNNITVRDIETVTTEIKTIRRQAQQVMLLSAIEIGRRLAEAKEMLPHGEWGKWLAESVDYSQSTADNLLRIYKEYGTQQESLFGNISNSEAFTKLSYTQALALLAVPAEEREKFAEANHVEDMSTRELQQAIRERDQARAESQKYFDDLEEVREDLRAADMRAEDNLSLAKDAKERAAAAERDRQELESKLSKATDARNTAESKVQKLQNDLMKAKEDAKKAKEQLAEAKAHPEIPTSVMEQMRAEVTHQAAEEATADLQKQLDAANRVAEDAEKARREAEEALENAQKAAKLQSPEIAVFGAMFEDLQASMNRINDHRLKTVQSNPDAAGGMLKALKAVYTKALQELEA